jgi:hypothetical protein
MVLLEREGERGGGREKEREREMTKRIRREGLASAPTFTKLFFSLHTNGTNKLECLS